MEKLIVRQQFLHTIYSVLFERFGKVGWKRKKGKNCIVVKNESKVRISGNEHNRISEIQLKSQATPPLP